MYTNFAGLFQHLMHLSCSVVQVYKKSKWELDTSEVKLGKFKSWNETHSHSGSKWLWSATVWSCEATSAVAPSAATVADSDDGDGDGSNLV